MFISSFERSTNIRFTVIRKVRKIKRSSGGSFSRLVASNTS